MADPQETNGPYPADGTNSVNGSIVNALTQPGIVRSDITSSFGSSTTRAPGVPVTLTINLENTQTSCELLIGYAIYIWHCNRDGEYSLYSSGITSENYLRGVQVTDTNGQVTFTTIFPGCYSGRYPHIHVEVYKTLASATSQANAILTTQLAMPRDVCEAVYGSATGYSQSATNLSRVTTATDNIFDSSSAAQLAAQTPRMSGDITGGYVATVTIGVTQ
jgi:protocatechuate 3,4-dioxygenase beta subunit